MPSVIMSTDEARYAYISNWRTLQNRPDVLTAATVSTTNGKIKIFKQDSANNDSNYEVVVYTHPTTDGNKHVPETGTTHNGHVLVAGSSAGSFAWKSLADANIVTTNTTQTISGTKTFSATITGTRAIFTSTTDAASAQVNAVALILGDSTATHLELDNNEILAKTGAATVGNLYLNENAYITASGGFYTSGGTITTAHHSIYAGTDGDTTREVNIQCRSGAGIIYLYSVASETGNRGLYVPAHGTGAARSIITVDTNNNVTFNGNLAWSNITGRPGNAGSATQPVYWSSNAAVACNFTVSTYNSNTQLWGIRYNGTQGTGSVISQTSSALIMRDNGLFLYGWGSSNGTIWALEKNSSNQWSMDITGSSGSCRGNAATASSAAKLTTARTLTIGSTGKTFDGSGNVSWSLSEIGAAAASHSHSYIPLSGSTAITGNLGINTKARGLFLTDSSGSSYAAIYDNGSNLWIGSTQQGTTTRVHTGSVYINAGWNGSAGNSTIYICVPTSVTGGGDSYAVLHAHNYTSYTVTKTGSGASGSWGISVTGSSASCTGNAATASSSPKLTLQAGNVSSTSTNTYATNGLNVRWFSAANCIPGQPTQYGFLLTMAAGDGSSENHQIFCEQANGSLYHRGTNGSSYTSPPAFKTILDSSNYTSYTVTKTGSGASGTWGINVTGSSASCTGNAATATKIKDAGDTSKALTIRYQGSGASATDWIPMHDSNGNLVPVSSTNLANKVRDKASGSWGISITGNAATATKATQDGSGNTITSKYVTLDTAQTISGAKTFSHTIVAKYSAATISAIDTANNNLQVDLEIGSGHQNHGVYSHGYAPTASTYTASGGWIIYRNASGDAHSSLKIYDAVWNDFAEFREGETTKGGYAVYDDGSGYMRICTERMQPGSRLTSDTFGISVGQTKTAQTPIGVGGRVLAYPYQDRNNYKVGDAVCSAPNGTIDIMTREEIMMYPERIIGIVSEIPNYDVWNIEYGAEEEDKKYTNIIVNGRIWVYVR